MSDDKAGLDRYLRRLPKVDLHCHLDGSVRTRTLLELARRQNIPLPADNERDLNRFVQVTAACGSLSEFLDVFKHIVPVLRSPDALERVAYELCEDCRADGIRYVEARFAPMLCVKRGFSAEEALSAALRGLEKGKLDFGVDSGVIVCLLRNHSPKENSGAFNALCRLIGRGVVGMDLAGDERQFPTKLFADYFEQAKSKRIPTTCHAGEIEGSENLKTALELGVDRIGHGIHILQDESYVNAALKAGIPLEIGLTSNAYSKSVPSLARHPLLPLFKKGLIVTLNTDDRGVLGIDLTHEYRRALELGIPVEGLQKISINGVRSLFAPPALKSQLEKQFTQEMEKLYASP
ncbi:MAG: adenosine deaminase [Elusimicrobia bacterium]|nr:adenosine deaminase [Elusimicrobiota bacterium]